MIVAGFIKVKEGKLVGIETKLITSYEYTLGNKGGLNSIDSWLVTKRNTIIETSEETIKVAKYCLEKSKRYKTPLIQELERYIIDNQ